jgi:hypothetical protein
MMTKKEYLNAPRQTQVDSTSIHRRYHSQFVTPELKENIEKYFGDEYLIASFYKDSNFNSIPLHEWDGIVHLYKVFVDLERLQQAGEGWSVAAGVCILKEAAKQLVEFQIN